MAQQIPAVDYLVLSDPPHLQAWVCVGCGASYFDRRNACARCFATSFARQPLGSEGVVRAFTRVERGAKEPFTSVVVDLTAGGTVKANLLGVDDPLVWAIGAFFLSFVPYVGLILAVIPPAILAFAESGPAAALIILIGAAVLNVVAENVLEPSMTGKALKLSTWLVFVMFFFTVWLIGGTSTGPAWPSGAGARVGTRRCAHSSSPTSSRPARRITAWLTRRRWRATPTSSSPVTSTAS